MCAKNKSTQAIGSSPECDNDGIPDVVSGVSSSDYTDYCFQIQSELDKRFTPHKKESEKLAKVYKALSDSSSSVGMKSYWTNRFIRIRDCGSVLGFGFEDGKLHQANFCKDRLCGMCNWRRSLKIFSQVSKVMNVLQESNDYVFLFLTLTVKNVSAEFLPDAVDALTTGWRNLYHRSKKFKKVCLGSFRALEITRNLKRKSKSYGTFHPHLHCILAVKADYFKSDDYMSAEEWSELWKQCCKLDYSPVIDVRRVYNKNSEALDRDFKNVSSAVAEACKYAIKGSDLLHGVLEEQAETVSNFLLSVSGRRLCSFTGCFSKARKKLQLDDVEMGDLLLTGEDPELRGDVKQVIVYFRWSSGAYVPVT